MMKRDMMRYRRKPLVRAAMGVALLVGCGAVLYFFGKAGRVIALGSASVPTECTVVSSEVRQSEPLTRERGTQSSTVYYATVHFFHEVEGRRYEASDEGPSHSCSAANMLNCGAARAEADARSFSAGAQVPCFRFAQAPSIAAVFPKDAWGSESITNVVFGFIVLGLTVFMFFDEKQYWKKH